MFKNLKLGTKLIAAFMSVAAITLVLGIVAYYGAVKSQASINELGVVRMPSVDSLLIIQNSGEKIRGSMRTLTIAGLPEDIRERQYDAIATVREVYEKAWNIYEPLPQTQEEAALWKKFVPAWQAWRVENNKALDLFKKFDQFGIQDPMNLTRQLEQFTKDHYILVNRIRALLDDPSATFQGGEDHTACNAGHFFPTFETKNPELSAALNAFKPPHQKFHAAVDQIKKLVKENKQDEARKLFQTAMLPAMQDVFGSFDTMLTAAHSARETMATIQERIFGPVTQTQRDAMDILAQIVQINRDVAAEEVKAAHAQSTFLKVLSMGATLVGVLLAITLGLVITRAITKPINRIIADLTAGAAQVSSASGQVSSASQSLAEGATEQAAGLEETSSSLEEMAAMTKQSAANAQQANLLAADARKAADSGSKSMGKMSTAIHDIQQSAGQTAKIIKVIDEIAFQTNLLALNAAVEAARAGEAGKGFAVVAEEVRNLAKRSAEAAKNTSALIEESVGNAKNGVDIAAEVGTTLEEIVAGISKTSTLVSEIAAASSEQSQGIDQINIAVTQMDKVTQSNAANAEESASAAEELSSQAEQMNEMISQLAALVGGSAGQTVSSFVASPRRPATRVPVRSARPVPSARSTPSARPAPASRVIPFDEDIDKFNS